MSKPETLASCIAKMYDGTKANTSGAASGAVRKPCIIPGSGIVNALGSMEVKLVRLESHVERIASGHADVLQRLDMVCKGLGSLEKGLAKIQRTLGREAEFQAVDNQTDRSTSSKEGVQNACSEVEGPCWENRKLLKNLTQEGKSQRERLAGIEESVSSVDTMLEYIAEVFQSSKVVEFTLKGDVPWRIKGLLGSTISNGHQGEEQEYSGQQKPTPSIAVSPEKTLGENEAFQLISDSKVTSQEIKAANHDADASIQTELAPPTSPHCPPTSVIMAKQVNKASFLIRDAPRKGTCRSKEVTLNSKKEPGRDQSIVRKTRDLLGKQETATGHARDRPSDANSEDLAGVITKEPKFPVPASLSKTKVNALNTKQSVVCETISVTANEQDQSSSHETPALEEVSTELSPNRCLWQRNTKVEADKGKNSFVQIEGVLSEPGSVQQTTQLQTGVHKELPKPPAPETVSLVGSLTAATALPHAVIDDCPPASAPFQHRIVTAKQVPMGSYYSIMPDEVLGGGRFGQVHKCAELSSGLTLAAKIIKVRVMRERDEVKNEIGVMNQLNHVNLIQLYDAFESRTNLILIMEYVEGGELFDRIVDENYKLTELDAIVFTKQICEGVQYLHQQYILHLDLKPENILCVSATGNQIKIIDFGLARKFRPREKLKVNFGTPEFLAPEVVNYDFVSFPTDMWSVGVIVYMLLSGLSPFLGDNDAETMNNILLGQWEFDSECFENVTSEAKDFISELLIPAKSGRLSASGCTKHRWLNKLEEKAKHHQVTLKSQIKLQRYLAAQRQWKKHFYVVTAANRLQRFSQAANAV
ncbi:myosin light chain kinase 3 isoform X1 [Gadus macrocephalus]|uniref:myosin light chain kinase 3 isoform X1 n=1 Tax=Gadus macrocephalus TaxID=80720 RepID=UPI0028CB618C|nr:myosin light chain kinase 3 isoform X1 [Gadus macrocephalus]